MTVTVLCAERRAVKRTALGEARAGERPAQEPTGVRLNEHLEHPEAAIVFAHACKMGLEGIVSKRLGSRYRSGRSPDWLKFKNPEAPAVKREAKRIGGADERLDATSNTTSS
jgi:ATP-dependent DNA ligase